MQGKFLWSPRACEIASSHKCTFGSFCLPGSNLPAHSRLPLQLISSLGLEYSLVPQAAWSAILQSTVCSLIPSPFPFRQTLVVACWVSWEMDSEGSMKDAVREGSWDHLPGWGGSLTPDLTLTSTFPTWQCWTLTPPTSL